MKQKLYSSFQLHLLCNKLTNVNCSFTQIKNLDIMG